jgi:hypothetical protein
MSDFTFQRSGVGEYDTLSVAIDMVTKSLANSSSTMSSGVMTNVPVTMTPTVRKTAISSVFIILLIV